MIPTLWRRISKGGQNPSSKIASALIDGGPLFINIPALSEGLIALCERVLRLFSSGGVWACIDLGQRFDFFVATLHLGLVFFWPELRIVK